MYLVASHNIINPKDFLFTKLMKSASASASATIVHVLFIFILRNIYHTYVIYLSYVLTYYPVFLN